MLVNALKLELPTEDTSTKVFSDISETNAYYPYAMAAYNAGLISGGMFSGNTSLNRETMYNLNMRLIGLERLGAISAGGITSFVDDAQISDWAKPSLYAASKLGLAISANGYVFPKKQVTYAECAAFLGQLIDYLRYDLQKDYSDYILNN
jgi:endo-1,4-beta-xylanase